MIVGVSCESYPGERRVTLVPAIIPNLTKAGLEIVIEAGRGGRPAISMTIGITAAVIPGEKSPVLVMKEMVARMVPGSVIVDLAAERGKFRTNARRRNHRGTWRNDCRSVQFGLHCSLSREPDVRAQPHGIFAEFGEGRKLAIQ